MRTLLTCLTTPMLLAQNTPGSPLPQAVLDVELHQAVLRNDAEYVKLLLARGARVDSETPDGRTPLFACASSADCTSVAKLLVGAKADVNHADKDGLTPLHAAAKEGNGEFLALLIEMGAKVDLKDKSARTPLMILAEYEKPLVAKGVQALINVGAQAEVKDASGVTPLMLAAKKGNVETMEILIRAGALPNTSDKQGRTPLTCACQEARDEAVKLLLDRGALPNVKDNWGSSALMRLESHRYREFPNGHGEVSIAPSSSAVKILGHLLHAGFDPKDRDSLGNTELHRAIQLEQWGVDLLIALVEAGCDPKATNDAGDDLLMAWAKGASNGETLKLIAAWGLDPNKRGRNGLAPIHAYLSKGSGRNIGAFKAFLDLLQPDIHLPGVNGAEPLAYAAGHSDPDHMKVLIKAGARVSHRDADGDTPLAEAMMSDASAKVRLLQEAGARGEDAFRGDWEALARDVKTGKAKERFAELALKDSDAVTRSDVGAIWTQGALLAAVLKGDLDFLKAAEAAGIDLSVPWRKGMEPFQFFLAYYTSPKAVPENLKPVQAFATDWSKKREAANQVRVSPGRMRMTAGTYQSFTFNAEVRVGDVHSVQWSVEGSPKDASIDQQGVFTASRPGIYRIVATCVSNHAIRGTAEVKVVNAVIETPVPTDLPKTHGGLAFIHLKGFRVLQVGGWDGSAPMNQVVRWDGGEQESPKVMGKLKDPRISALGIALGTKKALICNGSNIVNGAVQLLRSAEIFDAETGESRPVQPAAETTTSTYFAHCGGSIVGLPDGGALLLGGDDGNERCSGVELYDPQVGRFILLDKAPFPTEASAVRLDDGRILIFGGRYLSGKEKGLSKRILSFDPKTNKYTTIGQMLVARAAHASTALPDGKILISGGCIKSWFGQELTPTNRCEVFNPSSGKSEEVGSMSEPKAGHAAALMPTGQVLTYGGLSKMGSSPMPCATQEIFSYDERSWRIFDHPRCGAVNPVLFLLPNGSMFNGGSAVEYDPAKRDKPEGGVKPVPHLCDRVMM